MTNAFNSRSGALWVQPGGPNSGVYFLGCHDLDAIEEPLIGDISLIRKFNPNGNGWLTVGRNSTPPDPVSTSITSLLFSQKDWLEKLNCPFTLFVLMRDCGPADIFTNYNRGIALQNSVILNRSYEGLVARVEEAESTVAAEINADTPLVRIDPVTVDRLTTAATLALNGVWTTDVLQCYGACGDTEEPGDLVFAASDSAVGPATGDVLTSINAGSTWAALATDPFGAGFHVMSVTSFMVGANTRRVLACREGTGAVQGQVAYSDDNGATWTVVSIGGAAVGHGTTRGQGVWALDSRHIWLASADGYIYFSSDGGATWTAQESGVLAVTDYSVIHFADENYGIAGNAADVIAITSNGGATWELASATGSAADITAVFRIDSQRMWVGTDDGELWYTRDGGVTWVQRTGFIGDGVGQIRDIEFANELIGYMTRNTAAPVGHILRTIDGGYTWDVLVTPTNTGLNDLMIADESTAYAVGEPEGGTSVILKVYAA